MSSFAGFGKPKYGGSAWGNSWGIKEGDNPFRILPPMHSLAESGDWSFYHGIHFGYSGTDSQDASKVRMRTFRCIQVKTRNGMVEQECPECNKIESVKQERKEREAQLLSAGTDSETIETELATFDSWLRSHNADRKHYVNVLIPSGDVGHLKISHRTMKALREKMKELQDVQKIDPIEPEQGVWFNIRRTGKKIDATDSVEVVLDDVTVTGADGKVRKLKDLRPGALTEAQAEKALSECKDLSDVGTVLAFEQIKTLTECSGAPEEVDAVFGVTAKPKAVTAVPATKAPAAKAGPTQAKPAAKTVETKTPAAAAKASPAKAVNPTDPALLARVAQIKAKKEAEAKAAAEAAAKEIAADESSLDGLAGMSDEDILAFMNSQTE